MNDFSNQMPEILTEEEAANRAAMIKASSDVAFAVNEMKLQLETLGWSSSEQAALMLFNTMLQTSFAAQMDQQRNKAKEEHKSKLDRVLERAQELASDRGFPESDVNLTCFNMIFNNGDRERAAAVWEDFYGEGTRGVMITVAGKAMKEIEQEEESKGNG